MACVGSWRVVRYVSLDERAKRLVLVLRISAYLRDIYEIDRTERSHRDSDRLRRYHGKRLVKNSAHEKRNGRKLAFRCTQEVEHVRLIEVDAANDHVKVAGSERVDGFAERFDVRDGKFLAEC